MDAYFFHAMDAFSKQAAAQNFVLFSQCCKVGCHVVAMLRCNSLAQPVLLAGSGHWNIIGAAMGIAVCRNIINATMEHH